MNLVTLLHDKFFLGQEFLTWLWWNIEIKKEFILPDGTSFFLGLGERLALVPLAGHEGARVAIAGRDTNLAEARQSLRQGKLLESARLYIDYGGEEYWFNLDAATLTPHAIRLPKTVSFNSFGEKVEIEGQFLERIALLEGLVKAINFLWLTFLELRTHQPQELKKQFQNLVDEEEL